jgi:predicted phosphoadenosine phosphosulfate sulfurtransferase
MNIENIIEEMRAEIRRLEQAIAVLSGTRSANSQRRTMSLAGRRRIAEAQKKRWARVRSERK